MVHTRITNNIEARIEFLLLVAQEVPEICGGPEMLNVIHEYNAHSWHGGRITLSQAKEYVNLWTSMEHWASRFNLKDPWCLDHLLETVAILSTHPDLVEGGVDVA